MAARQKLITARNAYAKNAILRRTLVDLPLKAGNLPPEVCCTLTAMVSSEQTSKSAASRRY